MEHLVFAFGTLEEGFRKRVAHEVRHGPVAQCVAEHAARYRRRRDA